MNSWERWLRRPRSLWLRKALFQVHLWTGIALGLYVFVISVSGSAIVFRNELYNSLWPGPRIVAIGSHRLHSRRIARCRAPRLSAIPGELDLGRQRQAALNQAIEIWLDRKGHKKQRLFDPYTGQDLGESRPYSIQLIGLAARPACESVVRQDGATGEWGRAPYLYWRFRSPAPCSGGRACGPLAPRTGHPVQIELEALQLATPQRDRPLDAAGRVHVRIGGRLRRFSGAVSSLGE